MCFLDASFSVPVRHVGAQGYRNDANNEAQSEENDDLKPLCEMCQKHGRHCTGATWRGPEEGPGISFFRIDLQKAFGRGLNPFFCDFMRFALHLGSPWNDFLVSKFTLCLDLEKQSIKCMLLEGPAAGVWLPWVFIICKNYA